MLNIVDKICLMGKISNNLEKHGKDEEESGFAIPITRILLEAPEAAIFLDDKYADRWLFNTRGKIQEPSNPRVGYYLVDDFDQANVSLMLSGSRQLDFEGCKIDRVEFQSLQSGLVNVDFKLYLHPGLGKENLLLQEHQNREIRISVLDAVVWNKKKSGQQDLDLSGKAEGGPDDEPKASGRKRSDADQPAAH